MEWNSGQRKESHWNNHLSQCSGLLGGSFFPQSIRSTSDQWHTSIHPMHCTLLIIFHFCTLLVKNNIHWIEVHLHIPITSPINYLFLTCYFALSCPLLQCCLSYPPKQLSPTLQLWRNNFTVFLQKYVTIKLSNWKLYTATDNQGVPYCVNTAILKLMKTSEASPQHRGLNPPYLLLQ